MFISASFIKGLALGSGLIMAIGAQNTHVLRSGLRREHVGLTVAMCILVDICLVAAGVAGMGALVQSSPLMLGLARWGGAAFLVCYGLRSWRAVFGASSLSTGAQAPRVGWRRALASVLTLSLLNPHVYLDTVVLLGSVGGALPGPEGAMFAGGAMFASVLWFTGLGYGATRLAPLFTRPLAWRCLDALTGTTMLVLGAMVALAP
ncbi:MAG: LysE/ArgO family amino acid transporter [Pseudomonadota bacterium]